MTMSLKAILWLMALGCVVVGLLFGWGFPIQKDVQYKEVVVYKQNFRSGTGDYCQRVYINNVEAGDACYGSKEDVPSLSNPIPFTEEYR